MKFNDSLKPLKGKSKKFNIYSFDIETHGYKNKFVIGGLYTDRYKSYTDIDSFIQAMLKSFKQKTYIVATNLGFDFFGTFLAKKELLKDFKPIMRGSRLIMAKMLGYKFIDTLNFSPSSVEKLGKMLKIPKLYSKTAKKGQIPRTQKEWKKYRVYNSRDCLISKTFIEQFQEVCNKLGCEMKMTIASTSMDLYRRKYMPCNIYKERIPEAEAIIYKAYYGGRTEAFTRGYIKTRCNEIMKERLYYYDYNSLYPSVMLNEYPYPSSAKLQKYLTYGTDISKIMQYHGISEVEIECPYMKYPLLPYKSDKLIFPIGTFKGYYTHIELRKALELGYKIKKVYKTLYYTKTFYPFKKYITKLYALRLKYQAEDNEIYSGIIKLFMNSLYGKFAMKNLTEIEIKDFTYDLPEEDYWVNNDFIGYKTTEKKAERNYIIPILSCYTTAYGRLKLYEGIEQAQPLYVDTDSLLSFKELETSKELGALKLEKILIKAIIVKPKMYYLKETYKKDHVKVKGFRKMEYAGFMKLIKKKPMRQMQFMKLKQSMKRNYSINQKVFYDKYAELEDNKRYWRRPFSIKYSEESEPLLVRNE